MSRRALLWVLVVVAAACHGWFDVRQRARVDRGPRYHRTDFTVYQVAAKALEDGEDPYAARNIRGNGYVYPPLLSVLLMPIADWAPEDAALLFYALSVVALVGLVVAVARLPVPGGGAVGRVATALACAGCFAFFLQSLQRGQVTVILLALQVGGLVAMLKGRPFLAGFLLALAGALRLTPLFAAGALGVGALAAWRTRGLRPLVSLAGGVVLGLVVGFVAIPALALGTDRATEVTKRWLEVGESVYASAPGQLEALEKDYQIDESKFKNQAPRRVFSTWAGWIRGARFEGDRPQLSPQTRLVVDAEALAVTFLLLVFGLVVGARYLRDPADPAFAPAFALVTALPLLMTRYTWPTHYVAVFPLLALAWAARPTRRAAIVFVAATALFYVAHYDPLEVVGTAGVLMLGLAALLFSFHARAVSPR